MASFPEPPPPVPPTSDADLDAAADRLAERKDAWTKVGIPERIAYLESVLAGLASVAEPWVEGGARLKGIAAGDPLVGEEWLAGPVVTARNARLLVDALRAGGTPAAKLSPGPEGRTIARVFPHGMLEKVMLAGVTADVWTQPGKPATRGRIYREKSEHGKVCLVLGGGNVSSIPPMDVLYKLFVEDEVCLLKMNPVNEHVGPRLEKAFARLVDDGFLRVVYGGADVGARAADHARVDTLHVTGSDRTYDAIVWGATPEERAERKAKKEPKNPRPFSAELGCVTPVLVVPGPWSASDIAFQARHVAGMVTQNASFNCNAAKVLVTARGWLQREAFLDALHAELGRSPARKAYYPGASQRYDAFLAAYPGAVKLGRPGDDVVPWTVIPDVPGEPGEYALTNEAFCGVLAEVALDVSARRGGVMRDAPYSDPARFLEEAVRFANERCWGTLSCVVLVHPATMAEHGAALERAIEGLRYGGVGVNAWPGLIYGLVSPTWGAFPGHPPEDIQSGVGVVHNTHMFDHPEKTVLRAPFRQMPAPPYVGGVKNLTELGRRMFDLETAPSWGKLAGVAVTALKG